MLTDGLGSPGSFSFLVGVYLGRLETFAPPWTKSWLRAWHTAQGVCKLPRKYSYSLTGQGLCKLPREYAYSLISQTPCNIYTYPRSVQTEQTSGDLICQSHPLTQVQQMQTCCYIPTIQRYTDSRHYIFRIMNQYTTSSRNNLFPLHFTSKQAQGGVRQETHANNKRSKCPGHGTNQHLLNHTAFVPCSLPCYGCRSLGGRCQACWRPDRRWRSPARRWAGSQRSSSPHPCCCRTASCWCPRLWRRSSRWPRSAVFRTCT